MSSKTRLCSFFLSFVALFCVESGADVALNSSSGEASVHASDCNPVLGGIMVVDPIPEGFTGTFASTIDQPGSDGAANLDTTISLNVADDGSSITASGISTFAAQTEPRGDPCLPPNVVFGSRADNLLRFEFEVSGAPASFHYEATFDSTTSDDHRSEVGHGISITNVGGEFFDERVYVGCFLADDCASSAMLDFELPIGTYSLLMNEFVLATMDFISDHSATLVSTWSLTIGGPVVCEFNWINPKGGLFA
ncbi:MAG: hypothetical protein AAB353_12390, partial [Candidatus Hydrogenedentota bacterium]